MAWAPKYQTFRYKCEYCGAMFSAPQRRNRPQKTCSRKCNLLMRGPEALAAMSAAGGAARAERCRVQFVEKLRALGAHQIVIDLAIAYARSKYTSAHAKGRASGYRTGWDEAKLSEVPGRRRA